MVGKLDCHTITSEFKSHLVPCTSLLVKALLMNIDTTTSTLD